MKHCTICNEPLSRKKKYCTPCGITIQARKNKESAQRRMIKFKELEDTNPEEYIHYHYLKYRQSAKQRDINFNISLLEFKNLWKKPCTYCGTPINTIGIDRPDSKKEYSIYNSVPCCNLCNMMKRTLPVMDFLTHIQKVYRHNLY
jgi:hypothetical protein